MSQSEWAAQIARKFLERQLPVRWAHTQRVAAQARTLSPILGADADQFEAAAWLHDIGYSPELAVTGFHPLDGARFLRAEGADERGLLAGRASHVRDRRSRQARARRRAGGGVRAGLGLIWMKR